MRVNSIISNQKQQNFQGFRINGKSGEIYNIFTVMRKDPWLNHFLYYEKIISNEELGRIGFAVKPDGLETKISTKQTIENALTRLFNKLKINFEIIPDKEVNPLIFKD